MTGRQSELLELLKGCNGYLSVRELAQKMFLSEPTIRRELAAMENKHLVRRVRGGAALPNQGLGELPLSYSLKTQTREKRAIAERAALLVRDQSTIFLDASSTALFMLPFLEHRQGLTLLTDGLETAQFAAERGINTYCIGGQVNAQAKSCAGPFAESVLKTLHFHLMFFSVPSVSMSGEIMHYSAEKAAMLREVMRRTEKRILLCNSEKLGKTSCFLVCRSEEVDEVICDRPLPPGFALRGQGGSPDASAIESES